MSLFFIMGTMAEKVWLTAAQQRTWLNYMRVYLRMEYEMNRQLQAECGLSLADYTVMNALSDAPGRRLQLTTLAATIGWERSRLSHHLQRMAKRGLVARVQSDTDGRATDATWPRRGGRRFGPRRPSTSPGCANCSSRDSTADRTVELGDLLGEVYQTILAQGALPTPEER